MRQYETVIGLEIHVELNTKSKIFCSCEVAFGKAPNTSCCPVCTGMPGSLPLLNEKVLEYAVMAGLATNCAISPFIKFDRKNYFYPDLPKAYQISQLFYPICKNGSIKIKADNGEEKLIGIHEIHMEEDAGKLVHDPFDDVTLVDYNRCGIPLLEIVSEPDIRSAKEAIVYIEKIKSILEYLEVSDCKMQEGSMRADINLSVRPVGSDTLGIRTEMKNMNSLKAIARAIDEESKRQVELLETGEKIVMQTRRWDENKDMSFVMRTKETADDYRYFPDPDLLGFIISDEMISGAKAKLPELMDSKKERYKREFNLPDLDIEILTSGIKLAKLFEQTISFGINPKEVSNWIMGDILQFLKSEDIEVAELNMNSKHFADVLKLLIDKKINRNAAKEIIGKLVKEDFDPIEYIENNSLKQISNEQEISSILDSVIKENKAAVEDYNNGKHKAFSFLVGQVMKKAKGKASPDIVNSLLEIKLNNDAK